MGVGISNCGWGGDPRCRMRDTGGERRPLTINRRPWTRGVQGYGVIRRMGMGSSGKSGWVVRIVMGESEKLGEGTRLVILQRQPEEPIGVMVD